MRTGLAIPATLSSIKPLSLNRVDTVHNDYTKLLGQFPELTCPTTKGKPVKHGITHKIVTKGPPVLARPRRLAPEKLVTAKCEFDDMIKLGDSEWSSELHMVPKKRRLETVRRLEKFKCSDSTRSIPDSTHTRLYPTFSGVESFFKKRLGTGILPVTCRTCIKQRLQHLSACSISLEHRLA